MKKKWLWYVPVGIIACIAFAALGGYVVMQLWNWLVPTIFGWHLLTFWQALALLTLCRILFGGHGGGFRRLRDRRRGRFEQWEKLTPEEREKLRQGMRGRCGWGPEPPREGNQQA